VSTEEQAEVHSLDAQVKGMRELCQKQGMTIVHEYVEPGASVCSDKRPVFQEMMAEAKKGLFNVLIVHKFDRFARNRNDAVIYIGLLHKQGISVVSVTEPLDEGPAGILVEGMLEVVAEWYSANLAQETKKGLRQRFNEGKNLGRTPFGYRLDEERQLVADQEEAAVVADIFSLYAFGKYTCSQIAQHLNTQGKRTRTANRRGNEERLWSSDTIAHVLRNPVYAGNVRLDGVVAPGKHHPIVAVAVARSVVHILDQRTRNHGSFQAKTVYELSCLVYCDRCSRRMVGTNIEGTWRYYVDPMHLQCQACNQPLVPAGQLEADINSIVEQMPLAMLKDSLRERMQQSQRPARSDASAKERLERAKYLFLDGALSQADYDTINRQSSLPFGWIRRESRPSGSMNSSVLCSSRDMCGIYGIKWE
jgi:site-specific DNA recombinase